MSSLNDLVYRTLGRHFVTLTCIHVPAGSTQSKILMFSGFLIELRSAWVYVTAGHVIRLISAQLAAGGQFSVWRLGDQTGGKPVKDTGVPFDFDIDRWLVIEDDDRGLDYAILVLDTLYCRALQAGGAEPIAKEAWGDHVTEHDQWVLMGVPYETVAYDGRTVITARFVGVPLTPTDAPPGAGGKAENQFYARLGHDSVEVVNDVEGMSGGPLFATKRIGDNQLKYVVIGVQSAWYKESRIVAACPLSSLGFALEQEIDEELARRAASGTDRTLMPSDGGPTDT